MNIEQMTPSELADKLNGLCVAEFAWPYLNKAATELRRLAARDAQWNALIAGQAGEAVAYFMETSPGHFERVGKDYAGDDGVFPLFRASLPAPQAVQADSRALALLREARNTLFMWRDVAPAVSLLDDIDKLLAAAPSPDGKAEQAEAQEHDLYTDADKDRPDVICDRNGQVTLDLCKRCGKGEAQLDAPCVPRITHPTASTEQAEAKRVAELERHNKALIERRQHDVADIKRYCAMVVDLEKKLAATQPTATEQAEAPNPLADYHREQYEHAFNGWEACKQECDRLRDLIATQPTASNAGEQS